MIKDFFFIKHISKAIELKLILSRISTSVYETYETREERRNIPMNLRSPILEFFHDIIIIITRDFHDSRIPSRYLVTQKGKNIKA